MRQENDVLSPLVGCFQARREMFQRREHSQNQGDSSLNKEEKSSKRQRRKNKTKPTDKVKPVPAEGDAESAERKKMPKKLPSQRGAKVRRFHKRDRVQMFKWLQRVMNNVDTDSTCTMLGGCFPLSNGLGDWAMFLGNAFLFPSNLFLLFQVRHKSRNPAAPKGKKNKAGQITKRKRAHESMSEAVVSWFFVSWHFAFVCACFHVFGPRHNRFARIWWLSWDRLVCLGFVFEAESEAAYLSQGVFLVIILVGIIVDWIVPPPPKGKYDFSLFQAKQDWFLWIFFFFFFFFLSFFPPKPKQKFCLSDKCPFCFVVQGRPCGVL